MLSFSDNNDDDVKMSRPFGAALIFGGAFSEVLLPLPMARIVAVLPAEEASTQALPSDCR